MWGCAFLLLLTLSASGYLYARYHANLKHPAASNGRNALWLRHQWVGESRSEQQYRELAALLMTHDISDAYFHVGPLTAQGEIPPEKYSHAAQLLAAMKTFAPRVSIQAWIGQVEAKGGGILDLANATVRANIIRTAGMFLAHGFDGIHYDIEPIYSGDRDFLDLLRQTKRLTATQHKTLSIASDEPVPSLFFERLIRKFAPRAGFWTLPYYREVAGTVDQIAVMMYDTALPADWLYGNAVSWVTRTLHDTFSEPMKDGLVLFIGVPTYDEPRWSFHARAENMRSGIQGVQHGLSGVNGTISKNVGVAIYAEWTTEQLEWELYRRKWIQQ